MAFWPGRGDSLLSIDYGSMRVGIVNYLFEHTIVFASENNALMEFRETHVFCFGRSYIQTQIGVACQQQFALIFLKHLQHVISCQFRGLLLDVHMQGCQ